MEINKSEMLSAVNENLSAILLEADMLSGEEAAAPIANIDGNRFLIELTQIDDSTSVAWILQLLSEKLKLLRSLTGQGAPDRFSIGASLYPNDGEHAADLVDNAILAQTKAFELGGKKAFCMFSTEMASLADQQLRLEKGIREALAINEFQLHFQPIVNLVTGEVTGAEALLRTSNSHLQNTPIDAVIEVAEKTGLIHELSDYVFRAAFSIINEWKSNGIDLPLISINVSAEQLKSKDIIFNILEHIKTYRIDPASIQLEMTETAVVTDIRSTSEILSTLQNYGFHIALDDFGTGQSSLSHLLEINPDSIKIDKTFVHSLVTSRNNQVLVTTINELAQKIGAKVIAEGVETPEQLDMLMKIGCHYVQGYLVSMPLPAHVFKDWLVLFRNQRQQILLNPPDVALGPF